jgi:hypothetical protein
MLLLCIHVTLTLLHTQLYTWFASSLGSSFLLTFGEFIVVFCSVTAGAKPFLLLVLDLFGIRSSTLLFSFPFAGAAGALHGLVDKDKQSFALAFLLSTVLPSNE